MKRIFSILALASVFSLAVPLTSEAAPPRKDNSRSKPSSVEKKSTIAQTPTGEAPRIALKRRAAALIVMAR